MTDKTPNQILNELLEIEPMFLYAGNLYSRKGYVEAMRIKYSSWVGACKNYEHIPKKEEEIPVDFTKPDNFVKLIECKIGNNTIKLFF